MKKGNSFVELTHDCLLKFGFEHGLKKRVVFKIKGINKPICTRLKIIWLLKVFSIFLYEYISYQQTTYFIHYRWVEHNGFFLKINSKQNNLFSSLKSIE